jgi:hypothetical protein
MKQKQDIKVKGVKDQVSAEDMLAAVPYVNEAMERRRLDEGAVMVSVPMKKPKWLVPPVSWVLPYSSHRRLQLDGLGAEVLDRCDGRTRVETIIEKFAADHKLSFREAQLAVTTFLRQLTQRGLIAIIGTQKVVEKP